MANLVWETVVYQRLSLSGQYSNFLRPFARCFQRRVIKLTSEMDADALPIISYERYNREE